MSVEAKFFQPRRRVTIVDLGSTLEVLCLRSLLEAMGASVTTHFIGAPQDVFATLDQKEAPPEFLVLCGHGTENGLVLGEYGEQIDTSHLVEGCLPPSALENKISLNNTVVLSTACLSGGSAYAQPFLDGGASLYAAPRDYPHFADALLFAHQFFHAIFIRREVPLEAAYEASRGCLEPDTFEVFSRERRTAPVYLDRSPTGEAT